jgi:hypothetical protein
VIISPEGIFKYILIEAKDMCDIFEPPTYFIRGDTKHGYHANNFEAFIDELIARGFSLAKTNYCGMRKYEMNKGGEYFTFECLGGGRIEHNYKGTKCFIYGYSQSYGPADHSIAQRMIA